MGLSPASNIKVLYEYDSVQNILHLLHNRNICFYIEILCTKTIFLYRYVFQFEYDIFSKNK